MTTARRLVGAALRIFSDHYSLATAVPAFGSRLAVESGPDERRLSMQLGRSLGLPGRSVQGQNRKHFNSIMSFRKAPKAGIDDLPAGTRRLLHEPAVAHDDGLLRERVRREGS
jgi:hypothetical protein